MYIDQEYFKVGNKTAEHCMHHSVLEIKAPYIWRSERVQTQNSMVSFYPMFKHHIKTTHQLKLLTLQRIRMHLPQNSLKVYMPQTPANY